MKATELEWLRWFAQNADFGPGDGDVRDAMRERFMEDTGKGLPKGWNYDSSGEEIPDPETPVSSPEHHPKAEGQKPTPED